MISLNRQIQERMQRKAVDRTQRKMMRSRLRALMTQ